MPLSVYPKLKQEKKLVGTIVLVTCVQETRGSNPSRLTRYMDLHISFFSSVPPGRDRLLPHPYLLKIKDHLHISFDNMKYL